MELGLETTLLDTKVPVEEVLEFRELGGSCICCTSKNELLFAIADLVRSNVDTILIETTGMAQPGAVAEIICNDSLTSSIVELKCIITVVDAFHYLEQLDRPRENVINEPLMQVLVADKILVNKVKINSRTNYTLC